MNPIKSFLALTAILCAYMLYAEENTYIKQQVAYKDHAKYLQNMQNYVQQHPNNFK